MRRKIKSPAPQIALRKSALSTSAAGRRSFPAWIDSDDRGINFSAASAVPRVRDALVLRTVLRPRAESPRHPDHADRVR